MNKEDMEEGEVLEEGELSDEEMPPSTSANPKNPTQNQNRAPESPVKSNEKSENAEPTGNDIEEFMRKKKEEFDQKVRNQFAVAGAAPSPAEKEKTEPAPEPKPLMSIKVEEPTPKTTSKKEAKRYRDHDSKPTLMGNGPDPTETMINSWMVGSKLARDPSPDVDPNDEFYFGAKPSSSEDKDYRTAPVAPQPQGDTDYRSWQNREEGEESTSFSSSNVAKSSSNEFGDTDYRNSSKSSRSSKPSSRHDRESKTKDKDKDKDRRRKRSGSDNEDEGGSSRREERESRRKRSRRSPSPIRSRRPHPGPPSRWDRPTICRFFRDGFCRDGDSCLFSHNAADSLRKPELCKYYQQGYCKKSNVCPFLHGEYPCKAFHKGECSKGFDCPYSHTQLSEFTQPIYDQMVRDEQLAANIKLPPMPNKRKTLLPMPGNGNNYNNGGGGGNGMGNMNNMGMNNINMGPGPPMMNNNMGNNMGMGGNNMGGNNMNMMNNGPPRSLMEGPYDGPPPDIPGPCPGPNSGMPFMPPGQLGPPPIPPPFAPPIGMMPPNPNFPGPGAPLYNPPNMNMSGNGNNNNGMNAGMPMDQQGPPQQPLGPPPMPPHLLAPEPPSVGSIGSPAHSNASPPHPSHSIPPAPISLEVKDEMKRESPEEPEIQSPSFNINEMLRKIKGKVQDADEPEESPASPPPQTPSTSGLPQSIPCHGVPTYRLILVDVSVPPNQVSPELLTASLADPKLRNDPRIKKQLDSQFNAVSDKLAMSVPVKTDSPVDKPSRPDPRTSRRDPRLARQQAQSSPQQQGPATSSGATNFQDPSQMDEKMKITMQLQMNAMQQQQQQQGTQNAMGMPGPMMPSIPPDMGMPPMFGMAPSMSGGGLGMNPGWMPTLGDGGGGMMGSSPNMDQDERAPPQPDPRYNNRSSSSGSRWGNNQHHRTFPSKNSPPSSSPPGDNDDRPLSMREKRKDNQYESPLSSGPNRVEPSLGRYNEMPNVKIRKVKSDMD